MRRCAALALLLAAAACAPALPDSAPPPAPRADSPAPPGPAAPPETRVPADQPAAAGAATPAEPAEPAERFDPSLPVEVAVSGDLVAQVAHGPVGDRRAIVYLHGVCGDVHKFRAWSAAAVHFGTVVAVLGDEKCTEPGRYKWGFGVERSDRRIVAALRAVGDARGAALDTEVVTLVGYSQGAARAEELVRAFPSRYRRAVLVAGPREHTPSSFRGAIGIAFVAGAKDLRAHLQDSAAKATKAGVRARYFELPGARHGEYGPDGAQVMGAALTWLFEDPTL